MKMTRETPSELDEIFRNLKTDAANARASCAERKNWEDYNGKYDKFEEAAKAAIERLIAEARRLGFTTEVQMIFGDCVDSELGTFDSKLFADKILKRQEQLLTKNQSKGDTE